MIADRQWVYRKYMEFSQKYFGGKMPDIEVKIGRSLNTWGLAHCRAEVVGDRVVMKDFTITISNAYDSPEKIKETTLLHEMIHIYDFYNYPEHFDKIVNGRRVRVRGYDAHGSTLFLPMAEMINRDGYYITKYVNEEEKSQSQYSDATRKRLEKPFCLCYAEYMKSDQENLMFMCTDQTLAKIRERYNRNFWKQFAPVSITVYHVSSPELRNEYAFNRTDYIRGYKFPMDKWFALLQHIGIEEQTPEMIYFNDEEMYEQRIIKLNESDLREIISETLMELIGGETNEPVDGGNAVARDISPDTTVYSIA